MEPEQNPPVADPLVIARGERAVRTLDGRRILVVDAGPSRIPLLASILSRLQGVDLALIDREAAHAAIREAALKEGVEVVVCDSVSEAVEGHVETLRPEPEAIAALINDVKQQRILREERPRFRLERKLARDTRHRR